ncbi:MULTISPECIES: Cro/CI family transcriptional regulator [Yersinia]|uniref:Cell division protein n=1 Tax=Yersinia rochesterensis TaxID=1604335 RepID=A0A8D4SSX2_9GAMM|nr:MULTISPECIES: Cro/CI family transcriptional regulator [Yersinia]AYD44780.1 cell division protein [Yersinia rochesterensis]CND28475.1 DNA-binding transcriptional regulator DicC [Yersinia intermedia]CQH54255.1 DNA-binding transcriptional regulator DicC [Yersinia enterocolitica]HDL7635218.1 cell division protein [Yersinia enterocolitica]HDL8099877.1 cell division protein [Yersinia enterocolitica]
MTVDELTDFFGSNKKAADFYGVTPEAISMWGKRKGRLIPKGRAIEADHGTHGALKYNPELYKKTTAPAA